MSKMRKRMMNLCVKIDHFSKTIVDFAKSA
ncbi:hypothetical protein J2Z65_005731 [Paenibacillus aceris]|uniref:Uncharacterized protein n=1 Tax=Paenibacillus aceris TaxID=869555 RepID=A0ABS4I7U9_9BACL|nr:hypothetical protein [Paenibacillus aceris]